MEIPYIQYFGLSEKPFGLTPDPQFFFESKSHKEALDHLKFFLSQREGFAVIYGDVGLGKTTLARIFLRSLDRIVFNTALILNPIMDEAGLLREVLKELGAPETEGSKKELFDRLTNLLLAEHRRGKETIIVIDEAQLLSEEVLEFIRILSNIETDKDKTLHIILVGQTEIIERLKAPHLRYLAQRITVVYRLQTLALDETEQYISYRLIKAGSQGSVHFEQAALRSIHEAARGAPRLINTLCDRCLLALYSQSKKVVDEHIVRIVLQEESAALNLAKQIPFKEERPADNVLFTGRVLYSVLAIALIVLSGLTANYYLFRMAREAPYPRVERFSAIRAPKEQILRNKPVPAPVQEEKAVVQKRTTAREASVTVNQANVRARPDIKSLIVAVLDRGYRTPIEEETRSPDGIRWYRVPLKSGKTGWLSQHVIALQ
jgi:type II secretory pathway predicted ATPase ExeA